MTKAFEFKIDHGGARAMLQSSGVQQHLREQAEQIAAQVQPQFQAHATAHRSRIPVRVVVDVSIGTNRAAATVLILHPAALRIEATHGFAASVLRGR